MLEFGAHARHLLHRMVVKPIKGFIQLGGQNTRCGPKQKHCLNHRHIKPPRRSPYPFPRSSTVVPIFPVPSRGSIPPPSSRCRRSTTCILGTGIKRPPSVVSHKPKRPPYTFLCFLNKQPLLLPLCPAPAHF